MTYIEQLERDVAEVRAEEADPADYLSSDFMPWEDDSTSEEEDTP